MTTRRVGTAALILLSLTPFLIIIATRGRATTVTTTATATLNEVTVEPTTASVTAPPDTAQSLVTSIDSGSTSSPNGDSNAADDEVGAVVVPLTSTTSIATPRVTTAGTPGSSVPGPQPTLGPDSSTTTIDTIDPVTVGICVFPNGAVASGIRRSACQGTFTTDPDEARRLSNELRGITTTTTTTSTSTTEPTTETTTTEPPATTTTTAAGSTSTTSTTASTSTTQAATTTTAVDVTPDG